jgi:exo-beta-1,3-glucanase (GH17 family)
MMIIGGLVGLALLAAIGIGVGVSLGTKHKPSTTTSVGNGGNNGGKDNNGTTTQTNPNDPSQFTKNPNLSNSFYGFAYTPQGGTPPTCGATQQDVIQDIQLLSQVTTRVRLYGSECNQTALVLNAVKLTKVDLQVYLGIYLTEDDSAYQRQYAAVKQALTDYGADHVAGITVGNEYILNNMTAAGATDPSGPVGLAAASFIATKVADVRSMVSSLNLGKNIPIGNSDAGSYLNLQLLQSVDYFMANVHPWFGQVGINNAAAWTWNFFQENDVSLGAQATNKPQMYIAETGWPTKSSDAQHASNGASDASEANLQIFLDTFVCQANQNGTQYFFFEMFDEEWKDKQFGGVEGWWGLFNKDKSLKNVKIPQCTHP